MKNYELIEHTADIGIKVYAKDLKQLFVNAASGMFDIIAERKSGIGSRLNKSAIKINKEAPNLEELLVVWLSELLFLYNTKEIIFNNFNIKKLTDQDIDAAVSGKAIANYRINTEIKAVTYHDLKIEKTKKGFQARVIFDV